MCAQARATRSGESWVWESVCTSKACRRSEMAVAAWWSWSTSGIGLGAMVPETTSGAFQVTPRQDVQAVGGVDTQVGGAARDRGPAGLKFVDAHALRHHPHPLRRPPGGGGVVEGTVHVVGVLDHHL